MTTKKNSTPWTTDVTMARVPDARYVNVTQMKAAGHKTRGGETGEALRGAGRGSAADLAGNRYEHYRVLMDDEAAWAAHVQAVRKKRLIRGGQGDGPLVNGQ